MLHQLRNKQMVLIDTAGFSQRDARLIGQLQEFSQGINMPINYYLVAPANAQYASLQGVVEAYQNVELQGCIFTKLDECYSLGEMLSIAITHNLPLSFVTDGQKVRRIFHQQVEKILFLLRQGFIKSTSCTILSTI